METIYLCIVVFLLCLAVFDLFVGVSNDAVNFLNSAIGAKVAKFRTVLIVASAGVALGAVMSSGMMDVARHGIMQPANFTFYDVMTIFLAVMVTDVIVLDMFNTLGMPTSTTVSLVFELLGGTFVIAALKIATDPSLTFGDLLNTDKALSVIVAIFVSVAIAFVFGCIVQWISRVVFTFNYKKHSRYSIALFGGIAFTSLAYFIFLKGICKSHYLDDSIRDWVQANTGMLLVYTFIGSSILMEVFHLLRINVFKFVVLMGTFGLAMAFAGNDLVNFIGVPLAGLDSYKDFMANANGATDTTFFMDSLKESAQTPPFYLFGAGVVMIIAMATSKKARNVIKTSVDLSRQDEGDEMFGTSRAARSIVRVTQDTNSWIMQYMPECIKRWIDSRFNKQEVELEDGAAFDVVRAAVNLVLASMLITIGTNFKLPLSTTYVTFMVAMGSSLADRAWSRESAVFRVTGVISVIGGWFITAAVAFGACAVVCLIMFYGGIVAKILFIGLVIFLLIRSNRQYAKKEKEADKSNVFRLMMSTHDPEIVWDLLSKHVARTQSFTARFAINEFNNILDGLENERPRVLRKVAKELSKEKDMLKIFRRQELLALKRVPVDIAIERNTWFHLGINSSEQYIYCLRRILDPVKEHVDNNFNPLPQTYIDEFRPIRANINDLMQQTEAQISTGRFEHYRETLAMADECKDELSVVRKRHIDRIQQAKGNNNLQVSLVYLNLLQESQQLLSNMRHQLRAAKKFSES
ncbi:MAG: inorganic phosphate transporter [Prevotella sp.]|uniref:inorganic phosphate transporter n=1 Tax=Prevotella sp. TaxID=59823 RepID=UPI0025D10C7E|nr:inorganic phosphate transporter [Prevotella sp.]MCI7118548.1 inorganic phosphate transporter [Prevotella sp.]